MTVVFFSIPFGGFFRPWAVSTPNFSRRRKSFRSRWGRFRKRKKSYAKGLLRPAPSGTEWSLICSSICAAGVFLGQRGKEGKTDDFQGSGNRPGRSDPENGRHTSGKNCHAFSLPDSHDFTIYFTEPIDRYPNQAVSGSISCQMNRVRQLLQSLSVS